MIALLRGLLTGTNLFKVLLSILLIGGPIALATYYRSRSVIYQLKVEMVQKDLSASQDREKQLEANQSLLVENQQKWAEVQKQLVALNAATAAARAEETDHLLAIRSSVASAKQGIANAPGANDRFDFSDAAFDLVRGDNLAPGGAGGNSPKTTGQARAGVGGR